MSITYTNLRRVVQPGDFIFVRTRRGKAIARVVRFGRSRCKRHEYLVAERWCGKSRRFLSPARVPDGNFVRKMRPLEIPMSLTSVLV